MDSTSAPWTKAQLDYVINHVFLPPKLPQSDDSEHESVLFNITLEALSAFKKHSTDAATRETIGAAIHGMSASQVVHAENNINELSLLKELTALKHTLPLYVKKQNAAILFSRVEQLVTFEVFELSPDNEAVMSTKGRLVRTFPATALSFDVKNFDNGDLLAMNSQSVFKLSYQEAPGMQPESRKAGTDQKEYRDTTHPGMVSEFLLSLLKPIGQSVNVSAVSKNTREEVLCSETKLPWHRSPLWLLIRVTLQLVFDRTAASPSLYKVFMAYFHSYVLTSADSAAMKSDIIYGMNAKIARRVLKLDKEAVDNYGNILEVVKNAIVQSDGVLNERWSNLQTRNSLLLDLTPLGTLQFDKDILVSLPALDKYISNMQQRQSTSNATTFVPGEPLTMYDLNELPALREDSTAGPHLTVKLYSFEEWIANHLDTWVQSNSSNSLACEQLAALQNMYFSMASTHYAQNPEAYSVCLLTMFEIWIALDRVATTICPLLAAYSAGIPAELLQTLLLPFTSQLDRLHKIEQYLYGRCQQHGLKSQSLLFDTRSADSFAARYYDQKPSYKFLHDEIEAAAKSARARKVEELGEKKAECARLKRLVDTTPHERRTYYSRRGHSYELCVHYCSNCEYAKQLNNVSIDLHEWPLPPLGSGMAKVVMFELNVPEWYAWWRDTTNHLLKVLGGKSTGACAGNTRYALSADVHLCEHFTGAISQRHIGLSSGSKPFVKTHWNGSWVESLTKNEVCVPNGFQYQYFDESSGVYIDKFLFDESVARNTTYRLPVKSQTLQRFINRSAAAPDGPMPNTVIASQDRCPDDMSLQEYRELATLPLGHHIQWENIMIQLAAPAVDLRKIETAMIIKQCIYQAGPPTAHRLRAAHQKLADSTMALDMVRLLRNALERVKENWESSMALNVFVAIATRVLTLSSDGTVHAACLEYLDTARRVTSDWISSLQERIAASDVKEARTFLVSKIGEIALICASTFDVEDPHMQSALASTANASLLIQCSIIVQESWSMLHLSADTLIKFLHLRLERILSRCYSVLAQHSPGLDDAVKCSFPAYRSGNPWTSVSERHPHLVTCQTLASNGSDSLRVDYDLLSGVLLVNGSPLNRPPEQYERHPLYFTLFGHHAVAVLPSPVLGMQLSTKKTFENYDVHLAMLDSGELVVQASNDNSTFETIPAQLFKDQYPDHFVEDYVHWLDFATKTVQFRSKSKPWDASSETIWTLVKDDILNKWSLKQDDHSLMPTNSSTMALITPILDPLSVSTRVHIVLNPAQDSVDIEIPALKIAFLLAERSTSVWSKQYRGFRIDEDQSLGTFLGLRNKLLLKNERSHRRQVLLPEAAVRYSSAGGHVSVEICRSSISKLHVFKIDNRLGRLLDNGSIHTKLYSAYLHALTSFCLPDPLTSKTGTEQTLSILRSAAVLSFDRLSQCDIELLVNIAGLAPIRRYYPAHEKVMQSIVWNSNLGPLCQHGDLFNVVGTILDQASIKSTLYPDADFQRPELKEIDTLLQHRDLIRSSTFRLAGSGAENHSVAHDRLYASRDCNQSSERAKTVLQLSDLVFNERSACHWKPSTSGYLWKATANMPIVRESSSPFPLSSMRYDSDLMRRENASLVQEFWPSFWKLVVEHQNAQDMKFAMMVWLSTMGWSESMSITVLQCLALMFTTRTVTEVQYPPLLKTVKPIKGLAPAQSVLEAAIEPHLLDLAQTPERNMTQKSHEALQSFQDRQQAEYDMKSTAAVDNLVQLLIEQWPRQYPAIPNFDRHPEIAQYINVNNAVDCSRKTFNDCYDNMLFSQYLTKVETAITRLPEASPVNTVFVELSAFRHISCVTYIRDEKLFRVRQKSLEPAYHEKALQTVDIATNGQIAKQQSPLLGALVADLKASISTSTFEMNYVEELQRNAAVQYKEHCADHVDRLFAAMVSQASSAADVDEETRERVSFLAKQWPRMSPVFFLQQLSRKRFDALPPWWKISIVRYGLALTALQKGQRLVTIVAKSQTPTSELAAELKAELDNAGHNNWDPMEYPETLLMEIEHGILVRDVQEQIAAEMREPRNGRNAVMQLNMGEGKSSVIVPIVAAALADGSKLVRVIVAKPQSKQMAQMLISKLGGMLNRQIHYLPFSRSLRLNAEQAILVGSMLRQCTLDRGILLVQPEHILSFKLMGLESILAGQQALGKALLNTQDYFDNCSRDIVDESDENFSPKFELIYTMGTQRMIESSPGRWICLQQVFGLVAKFACTVATRFPDSVDLKNCPQGQFPRLRLLRPDAGEYLVSLIARDICENGLESFPVSRQLPQLRDAILTYITKFSLTTDEVDAVEKSTFWTETIVPTLLLLRGLLGGEILTFCLMQKRWRVNYGLTSTRLPRTLLAVPFRAKDNPSARAEFSHPDVVIMLTMLSYYYEGLHNEHLFDALTHLMDSDKSDIEYAEWVKDSQTLKANFRSLQGLNLKDRLQCEADVFPALRKGKSVIDYFLSHIVFPKEMREFPHKLSSSGWDIGKIKKHVTTGFSGTKDSRALLPLYIEHLDLPEQQHTNALVLEYLLQPKNSVQLMSTVHGSTASDAEQLLDMVVQLQPEVQVILDVGAQILELDNLQVATAWLERHPDPSREAAVFCNTEDDLCVVDRRGRVELLQTSSFLTRLDVCLVFLDEAHTRGIDLKLPRDFRAAVTLGAGLTKDKLIQACMRMRKLSSGQSIVFCVSEEIQMKIRATMSGRSEDVIELADVLKWSIIETFIDIRKNMPLWMLQGERFVRHRDLMATVTTGGTTKLTTAHAEKFLEEEARSLEERYRPQQGGGAAMLVEMSATGNEDLSSIVTRCMEFQNLEYRSTTLREEQERELSPEVQQERQRQNPPPADPAGHKLHPHVEVFWKTGSLPVVSPAYMPAFDALHDISAAADFDVSQLQGQGRLLVTADFAATIVKEARGYLSDSYQRGVQWILTSHKSNEITKMLILSPFEANQLRDRDDQAEDTTLHLFKIRCNMSYDSMDRLDFHTVPARTVPLTLSRYLAAQLNLFAGTLYLSSYSDYVEICKFLGLGHESITAVMAAAGWRLSADGFIECDADGRRGGQSGFWQSPVKFMKVLLGGIRKNGEGIAKTHMGSLLDGKLLRPADFGE